MKKYLIAIVAAVVATLLVMMGSLLSRPEASLVEEVKDAVSVLPEVQLSAANALIDEDYRFETQDADAQLVIDGIEGEVGVLIVDFVEPLQQGTPYQLFYSVDGSGLSEMNSILSQTRKETDSLVIGLPEKRAYDFFRLDIDANYQIADLAVGGGVTGVMPRDSALTAVLRGRDPFPRFQLALCFAILLGEALLIAWKLDAIRAWFGRLISSVRDDRKGALRALGLCAGGAALGLLVWLVLYKAGVTQSSAKYTVFYFAASGLAIGVLLSIRRLLGPHPEYGFLVISLCFGLMFAVMEPSTMLISWDDETHYGRAVALSYGNTSFCTEPERIMISRSIPAPINLEGAKYCAERLDAIDYRWTGSTDNIYAPIPRNTVFAYLAPAGAIWLTRLLNLPFTATVVAGRVANLLCYAIVILIAIRQLKYGRLLVSCLCLNPTILFLAGNYAYDPFCVAFIMLGLCIWLGVYQTPGSRMTPGKAAAMLLSLLVGLFVKQVYFPLALITLFLPADKFRSKREAWCYRGAVLAVPLVLLASFVVPLFAGSGVYSDTRGGGDVNAGAQASNILHHPLYYMKVLARFLLEEYFSLTCMMNGVGGCVRAFAYVANSGFIFPEMMAWIYIALTVAAWFGSTDSRALEERLLPGWLKSLALIVGVGTVCIVVTSLYCAFTPVGYGTVMGCQERYMLPAVFAMILVARPTFLKNTIPPQRFNAAVLYSAAAALLIGTWPWAQMYL